MRKPSQTLAGFLLSLFLVFAVLSALDGTFGQWLVYPLVAVMAVKIAQAVYLPAKSRRRRSR